MEWSNENVAILIVFDMWGYQHEQIKRLLERRSVVMAGSSLSDYAATPVYQVSIKAIKEQLKRVRSENRQLWRRGSGWNKEEVTAYLCRLSIDRRLLELSEADIASMLQVRDFEFVDGLLLKFDRLRPYIETWHTAQFQSRFNFLRLTEIIIEMICVILE
jgi:hypothetical protein